MKATDIAKAAAILRIRDEAMGDYQATGGGARPGPPSCHPVRAHARGRRREVSRQGQSTSRSGNPDTKTVEWIGDGKATAHLDEY
ncbi:MAG: hypothetical protein IPI43_34415 [Sandaracinaceae bacterium]|nr:hypothetical protein [Sandaracinaceae bacterium]